MKYTATNAIKPVAQRVTKEPPLAVDAAGFAEPFWWGFEDAMKVDEEGNAGKPSKECAVGEGTVQ